MTKVVFMGTPAFSVPILEGLVAAGYEVLAVVTQPDRPVGRSCTGHAAGRCRPRNGRTPGAAVPRGRHHTRAVRGLLAGALP